MIDAPFMSWQPINARDLPARHMGNCSNQNDLSPRDPRHEKMFVISDGWITLFWGGYAYDIDLGRLESPEDLLSWVLHLTEKDWKHTTARRLRLFILHVAHVKGFDPWEWSDRREGMGHD